MMHLWPIFRAMRSVDKSYRIRICVYVYVYVYAYLLEKNHLLEKIEMETVLYKFYIYSIESFFFVIYILFICRK